MPRTAMTAEQIEEVRRKVLREAAAIVQDEGVGALSMRYLASKLGMTGGALYRYFPSRQDVLLEYFAVGMAELYAQVRASAVSANPYVALRDLTMSYADFALSDPVRYRLMFLEDNHATRNAGLIGTVTEAYGEFVRRTRAAIDAGALSEGEAKKKTDVIWAALHGSITLAITAPEMDLGDPREFVERTIDTILNGLST